MPTWLDTWGADALAFAASALLIGGYYALLWRRARHDPHYTIHGVNETARTLWVHDVMGSRGKDVMAVQTLRNYVMAATFMASTSVLLIVGTLTLSGQTESLARTWHAINIGGSGAAEAWIVKVMCLLTDFIVAFFAFAMAIRLLNHVVFMINVSDAAAQPGLAPREVAHRLIRAGHFYSVGMRAFFVAVPLVFWLFGPLYLVVATIGLVIAMHWLERSPRTGGD
ncbi:MAG: DUF599 domain-containing protein [Betaproteobacteria bacterium]